MSNAESAAEARVLCRKGYGCFPVSAVSKFPVQAKPADDPENLTGRWAWTDRTAARWSDCRWQLPREKGGSHQAVWHPGMAVRIFLSQKRPVSVAVTSWDAAVLDVDRAVVLSRAEPGLISEMNMAGCPGVLTPSGGLHLYFRQTEGDRLPLGAIAVAGVHCADLKTAPGYVVAPQEVFREGRVTAYRMRPGGPPSLPAVKDLPLLPKPLTAKIRRLRNGPPKRGGGAAGRPAESGCRNGGASKTPSGVFIARFRRESARVGASSWVGPGSFGRHHYALRWLAAAVSAGCLDRFEPVLRTTMNQWGTEQAMQESRIAWARSLPDYRG